MTPRPLRTALPLLTLALLVTACSSSTTPSAARQPTQPPATATTPPTAGSATPNAATPNAASANVATPNTAPAAAPATITIRNFIYAVPASVHPGAAVTVVNKDGEAHTVTIAGGSKLVVQGGMTATLRAPSKPGKYKISCDFHGNMHSDLLVS